ncbi:hypothetical protein GGQ81_000735 [Sphingomonas desiccabilis]|nr:hypothetical protein [Sphingomonas desiccabilis]
MMFSFLRREAKPPRVRGFCADCRYRSAQSGQEECRRPTSKRRDPVSGQPSDIVGRSCHVERADEALIACGPYGRFYQRWDW